MSGYVVDTPFDRQETGYDGPVMAIKLGIVNALRQVFQDTPFGEFDSDPNTVHIDMEYPVEEVNYPAIWVQFSITKLDPAGIAHVTEQQNDDGETISLARRWMYEGRVSLIIVSLSSIQRDRIADRLIETLAFSSREDTPRGVEESNVFLDALDAYPHISIMVNTDRILPGGQSTNPGTPWNPDTLVSEDSYSFEIMGEFEKVTDAAGATRLRRIDIVAEHDTRSIKPGTWI